MYLITLANLPVPSTSNLCHGKLQLIITPLGYMYMYMNVLSLSFDVLVIGGAMIATIAEGSGNLSSAQGDTLDFILVMRVLRLIKIVNGFNRFVKNNFIV